MTNQELLNLFILDWYYEPRNEKIYGLMYGRRNKSSPIQEDITEIYKTQLQISRTNDSFFYVWGMPGPDYNRYDFCDYGITWAFSKEKLIEYYKDEFKKGGDANE